ncbi:MAG: 3-hydroxyacyl-ACP dehydratase FabZ [Rhodospirillales bacterium]|jgi:3-hydroxyacyl-[acyl-carrier-protein] dehydratase|tara:strand:- start:140 stop:601 length:462 start_codon:yes stop_codon:yes gene_type:complete
MDNETTSEIPTIEVDEIMQMIPHRYPFLLIDRVKNVVFDTSAVGIKNVTVNEPFFQGHFPGHPIMPGVLLIEAMAQTSAVLVIKTTGKVAGSVVYFMTVDNARFRKPVRPGDQVKLHVEKVRNRGNVWKFKGEARVDGKLMAEAAYSAMIVDS